MGTATAEFEYGGEKFSFVSRDDDPLARKQLKSRTFYEAKALERQARLLGRFAPDASDWIVDAGANIGNHAVFYAKYCGVGRVVAYEMNNETFGFLKENIRRNGCSDVIDARNVGLSNRAGTAGVNSPKDNPLGGASLDFKSTDQVVSVRPLDDTLGPEALRGRCLLFKIDVEGHELEVLQGARELLRRSMPLVYLEIKETAQWQSISQFLSEMDYSVVYAEEEALPNFLFAHRSTIDAIFFARELQASRMELSGRVVDAFQLYRVIRGLQRELAALKAENVSAHDAGRRDS